jgi:hypothetical protein
MGLRTRAGRAALIGIFAVGAGACGDEDSETSEAGEAAGAVGAVGAANRAPVISGSLATIAYEDELYEFAPTASDPDGDSIVFAIDGKPEWAVFDPASGRLSGTPDAGHRGWHRGIVIRASDGAAQSQLAAAQIQVMPPPSDNAPPAISGSPAGGVTTGAFYDFIPIVSDADGDPLSFSIRNLPGWAQFDPEIGRLFGTPGAGAVGVYGDILIEVSDGVVTRSLDPFVVVVNPPPGTNTPPVIGGVPSGSVVAGGTYLFTPQASDVDGDALRFSAIRLPAWARFDAATGTLSGTPGESDAGTYTGISIVVDDGVAQAALQSFSIAVASANRAPTIAGTPGSTVIVGDGYSFVPAASDPDGDALTFSVSGLPSWARFNQTTGALTGTPGPARVGVYNNVRITVTDGLAGATLGPFSIEVLAVGSGTATLSWAPPTQNTDGSPLVDLAGYMIYWGSAPGTYTHSARLPNAGLTSYVVENLASDTIYYFATTAYNGRGLESGFSNEAALAIP